MRAVAIFAAAFVFSLSAWGQVIPWTREDVIKYTPQWTGERLPDGRPNTPDALLEKVKGLTSADAQALARLRFPNQFVGDLQILHPGTKLVGRAVTLQLMPTRPDVAGVAQENWRAKGNQGALNHQTAIDVLQPGDVLVIDAYGSLAMGGIIGDNLAYYIWKKTGAGFVIDGPIRDLEGIGGFEGLAGYFRWAIPPAIQGAMVMGINTPVRIGGVTVMPGDIVLGDRDGVTFIPPQLVQQVVDAAAAAEAPGQPAQK